MRNRTVFLCVSSCCVRGALAWSLQHSTYNRISSSLSNGDQKRYASSTQSFSFASEYSIKQRAKELREDKILENEEFHWNEGGAGEGEVSVAGPIDRLRRNALLLELERHRLLWALYNRRQLLASLHGGSLLGRPADISAVLEKLQRSMHEKVGSENERDGDGHSSLPTRKTASVEALAHSPFLHWKGSSSSFIRFWGFVKQRFRFLLGREPLAASQDPTASPETGVPNALTSITEDLDYLRTYRELHRLPYYKRFNVVPKRNIWHAIYHTIWNAFIGVTNALWALVSYPTLPLSLHHAPAGSISEALKSSHTMESLSVRSIAYGSAKGVTVAAQFLVYGLVALPAVHLWCGTINGFYGFLNFFSGKYMFDALSGRWMRCAVADAFVLRTALQREKRLIRAVGRMEFKEQKMKSEEKWKNRMASLGFSMENFQEQMMGNKRSEADKASRRAVKSFNPYDVLHVKRNASTAAIKAQYKKLAMVFHPDVAQSRTGGPLSASEREQTQAKFEEISRAYQILSNSDKRKAFDLGGEGGLAMQDANGPAGSFFSRTPEEIVQHLFGGESFRCLLVGELLRSHWALRYEAQVSVSIHELEELQCIRVRQMAIELAAIADVHATLSPSSTSSFSRGSSRSTSKPIHSKKRGPPSPNSPFSSKADRSRSSVSLANQPGSEAYGDFSPQFVQRCDVFVRRLSDACFGRELMHEIGLAYVVGSKRFLGLEPFYAPKKLVTKKIFTGIDRIWEAFKDKDAPNKNDSNARQTVARKVMVEYFNMEYDNVVADLHVCLRFAVQLVLQDAGVSETVRRRRCFAVWLLGEKMLERGIPFEKSRKEDDSEMMAYIQQAATSSATTAPPKPF